MQRLCVYEGGKYYLETNCWCIKWRMRVGADSRQHSRPHSMHHLVDAIIQATPDGTGKMDVNETAGL